MIIGTLFVELRLFGCKSLKNKRSIIKPLLSALRSKFNISVSEISKLDSLDTAVIGICCISNSTKFVNKQLSEIENHFEHLPDILVITIESQVL